MAATTMNENGPYDTLVLGAGMSGLACASRLFQDMSYRRQDRLLVLEGRDRIGGRINSVHVNGCRLDTGANWIHGIGTKEEPNPLMEILPHKKYQQLSGTVAFRAPSGDGSEAAKSVVDPAQQDEWVELEPITATEQSHLASALPDMDLTIPTNIAGTLISSLWSVIGSLHELAVSTSANEAKNTTMLRAITMTDEFQEAYQKLPREFHHSLSAMPQFIENMEAAPLAAQSAEHPEGRPGMNLLEFAIDDFDGDQVFLQDGYTAVVEEVAKHLIDADRIKLGVEIKEIRWNEAPIVVETSTGKYTANQVICALPLGVLQHHVRSNASVAPLFQPPLPSEKQEAIESLGFGTLDKIMLIYEHPWWTEEPYTLIWKKGLVQRPFAAESQDSGKAVPTATSPDSFLGFTDELPGIEIHQDCTTSPGLRVLSVINLHNLTSFPVLSAFVSCSNATQVEATSDEQAGDIVHRALTKWIGREPPKPDAVHVSRWAQDEFSRGSYSHMITGLSENRHREEFQKPIVNGKGATLRFAGEHTSRNHFATVHGALLSGWREADDMLKSPSG